MTGETPGFLYSPGWPESYPPNQECTWLIRSPDSTVALSLLSVDMEGITSCYYDSLVIRDGRPRHPTGYDDEKITQLFALLFISSTDFNRQTQPVKTVVEFFCDSGGAF